MCCAKPLVAPVAHQGFPDPSLRTTGFKHLGTKHNSSVFVSLTYTK